MARVYKSARGKMIDMDKVKLSQETTNAVGNMRVNARGDLIGTGGKVATGRNAVMDQVYAVNSAPEPGYSPNDPATHAENQNLTATSKAQALHDLASNLVPTSNPETPVAETPVASARGSLANSVARPVTVTQDPVTDPRKPKGPTRI
jgi:hypothetical protein